MITLITQSGNPDTDFIHFSRNGFWKDIPQKFAKYVKIKKHSYAFFKFWKVVYTIIEKYTPFHVPSKNYALNQKVCISLILGPDFSQFLWYKLLGYEIIPILLDGWPSYYDRIHRAIKILGIKRIFFSASDNLSVFNSANLQCFWCPEAINWEDYPTAFPLVQKKNSILNFGRKWEEHHSKIYSALESEHIDYQYEKVKGKLIFDTNNKFLSALNSAKICICVPSNISHPMRSGNIETITSRYFQCMRMKNIIVGKAPKEMIELFGYNPVIEINMDDPANQLIDILNNSDSFTEMVERNYETVNKYHRWQNRWEYIISKINNQ